MSGTELPLWAALPAAILLVAGGLLALVGSLGLLTLRDFYARMHPPTMTTTLGAGCVLAASLLVASAIEHRPVSRELLITLFLTIASPVTAIVLMRAGLERSRPPADGGRSRHGRR